MPCLPPVVAPIPNDFAEFAVIVHKKLRNRCSTGWATSARLSPMTFVRS